MAIPLHLSEKGRRGARARRSKWSCLPDCSHQDCHHLQERLCPVHHKDLQFPQLLQQWTWEWRQWKVAASVWRTVDTVDLWRANLYDLCEDIIMICKGNSSVVSPVQVRGSCHCVWLLMDNRKCFKLSTIFSNIPVSFVHNAKMLQPLMMFE